MTTSSKATLAAADRFEEAQERRRPEQRYHALQQRILVPLPPWSQVEQACRFKPFQAQGTTLRIPATLRPTWMMPHEPLVLPRARHGSLFPTTEAGATPKLAASMHAGRACFCFDPLWAIEASLDSALRGTRSLAATALADRYLLLPGKVRLMIHGAISRGAPVHTHTDTVDAVAGMLLRACSEGSQGKPARIWPRGKAFAVCLTHDIDTPQGIEGARRLAAVEEEMGLRSAFFAPENVLARGEMRLAELVATGFEVGLHGWRHRFSEADQSEEGLAAAYAKARRRFAHLGLWGFRAPGLLTSPTLLAAVRRHFFYDSSARVSGTATRLYRQGGCGTRFPFLVGPLVMLPIAGPLDDKLVLGRADPKEMLAQLESEIEKTRQRGGLYVLVNHCEPHLSGKAYLHVYAELIAKLRNHREAWIVTPHRLALHCRALAAQRGGMGQQATQ